MPCSVRTLYSIFQSQLRAQVIEALTEPATRVLADDLGRALTARGRGCRRVTLDALSLLHPAGPGVERPAHPAEPGDDPVPRRRPTRLPVAKQLSGSTRLLEGVAGSISLVDGDAGYTG